MAENSPQPQWYLNKIFDWVSLLIRNAIYLTFKGLQWSYIISFNEKYQMTTKLSKLENILIHSFIVKTELILNR